MGPIAASLQEDASTRTASRRVRSCETVKPPVGGWAHARKHVVLDEIRRLQQELVVLEQVVQRPPRSVQNRDFAHLSPGQVSQTREAAAATPLRG